MAKQIWTNKAVDEWIKNNSKNFKRVGIITSISSKIEWLCLKENCDCKWEATFSNIKNNNSGCPKCAGNLKITNESIDVFLSQNSKLIKRIEGVSKNNTKIKWKCLKEDCNYIWSATPNDIKNGYGCPNCAGNLPLTNKIMDQYLIDNELPIQRIGELQTALIAIEWNCLVCNYNWHATPNSIRSKKTGCPICNKRGTNEKLIDKFLMDKGIPYITQYKIINDYSLKNFFMIDFYIPKLNLFIEYNGIQHYKPTKFFNMTDEQVNKKFSFQQKRDEYVRFYCKTNNINLIEIDGRIYQKQKLTSYLNSIFIGDESCHY